MLMCWIERIVVRRANLCSDLIDELINRANPS